MADYDPESLAWSIMTKSHGGTVSVIRGLNEKEAAQIYERLDPWYGETFSYLEVHPNFEWQGGVRWGSYLPNGPTVSKGDLDIIEVFGPEGWEGFADGMVTSWPKHCRVWTDSVGEILPDDMQENPGEARMQSDARHAGWVYHDPEHLTPLEDISADRPNWWRSIFG